MTTLNETAQESISQMGPRQHTLRSKMGDDRDFRLRSESRAEGLSTIVGLLLLTPMVYFFLKILHVPNDIISLIVSAAIPVLPLAVRSIFVRRSTADRPIREALVGAPAINPLLVCVAAAAFILFVEQLCGGLFGSILGVALGFGNVNYQDSLDISLTLSSIFSIPLIFLSTWPIIQVASHYLRRFAILWIIASIILSRILSLGTMVIGLRVLPSAIAGAMPRPWPDAILGQSAFAIALLVPGLIGYFAARRTQASFLLRRAFRKLDRDDREAVLDLLMERQSLAKS